MDNILKHVDDIEIYPNEYQNKFVINRCLRKLIENDKELEKKYSHIVGKDVIKEYSNESKFEYGDVVWFKSTDNKLYLLRKTPLQEDGHSENPQDAIDDTGSYKYGQPDFEQYGWTDLNPIPNPDRFGIKERVRRQIANGMFNHQNDSEYHSFGKLTNDEELINGKVMLKDMSNVSDDRSSVFFPYQTYQFSDGIYVLNGLYRVWDNGLVEMDITYRFGYVGIDGESGLEVLTCNNVEFSLVENKDNNNYFNSLEDAQIFKVENASEENFSQVDDMIQKNRNNYVNTYFSVIRFPQMKFAKNGVTREIMLRDRNYMIFGSDVMSQDRDFMKNAINIGANCITYGDRTQSGFTAIYVTYPDANHYSKEDMKQNYNCKNGGLVSNSFNCHIVGRWTYL